MTALYKVRKDLGTFRLPRLPLLLLLLIVCGQVSADPIHVAVQSLDMKRLLQIVDIQPETVNATDSKGISPLHYAAGLGSKEFVEILLKHGANAHLRDQNGNTPLHWAANVQPLCFGMAVPEGMEVCFLDVVQRLASAGASVNEPNALGETSLHLAARQGVYGLVKTLLDLGADPNTADASGSTPLHWAIGKNAAIVAGLMLSKNADPNRRDGAGRTAFECAQASNDPELLSVYKEFFRLRREKEETGK